MKYKKLKEKLKQNDEYFDDNEKDIIETQKKIKKLNNFNDELNKENQKIKEELDN